MKKFKRRDLYSKYFLLEIFECPKEIILFTAQLGSKNVTVENFTHYGRQRAEFQFGVCLKTLSITPALKRFDIDFSITKIEFMQMVDVWDEQGCYALFHDVTPLKFKATDLLENQRYQALDNFGWTIEIAIPNSASDGWGQITSPSEKIINTIEAKLRNF